MMKKLLGFLVLVVEAYAQGSVTVYNPDGSFKCATLWGVFTDIDALVGLHD